jgi:hypothetical protein
LDVVAPPAPDSVTVETVDHSTFQVSWEVTDPSSLVRYYNIYRQSEFTPLALVDSTSATSVSIPTENNVVIPGVVTFCIGSVSDDHVESRLTCGSTE